MVLYHFSAKALSRSTRNTVGAVAYRAGCELHDVQTGETFNYTSKDVQHVDLVLPKDAPAWAIKIQNLIKEDRQAGVQAWSEIAEAAEKRIDAQAWREIEVALHRELTDEQNRALSIEFAEDQLCGRGMAALLNFHFDVDENTGEAKPHCHILLSMRRLEENGWSQKKERDWNAKTVVQELREQWAAYSNFHLKLHGHEVQVDHRSYKNRGIDIEPQPKQGKGILEIERKAHHSTDSPPVTDKAKEFQDVHIRNLYRLLRRPEVVLDIVSKHNATFMWGDVQKVLHRYIDEAPLFQRMESRLRNSTELLNLRSEGISNEAGGIQDKSIYTTKAMVKKEASLVELAEHLGKSTSHGMDKSQIEREMIRAYQNRGIMGGLSVEQERAIQHLLGNNQLSCVVGIAGSGKTTLLGVCHEVWKSDDYSVYGLAPTGRAAQNLQQSGIPSTTLHKFLKEFDSGRCQYNPKSVLVLDEAGMVDVERFSNLLKAVNQLGVKLVVVGDGAQLQPVEAGPAFRLVTERVGKSELTTVVRQKEDWQKEVTLLFCQKKTNEAIKSYMDKGNVHIIDEKVPSLTEALVTENKEKLTTLYEMATHVAARMYREMARDVEKESPENTFFYIKQHQDYMSYLHWKTVEKASAPYILKEGEPYEKQGVDIRKDTKDVMLKAWHANFQENPETSSLMLAFMNKDVADLNEKARVLLKQSGHIAKEEFTYTIKREIEDDFGRKRLLQEDKGFSKGDRVVFTRNNQGLGVQNGSMGTIVELKDQRIRIQLDGGDALPVDSPEGSKEIQKDIFFSPNIYPFFDHGWAITIHKSQGTTVDKAYVLASAEMTQNLSYTRRE